MDYTTWERSNPNKRVLRNLVLSKDSPGASDILNIYDTIINDEGPVIALLENSPENHYFRAALVSNPDEMLPRLSYFLRSLMLTIFPGTTQSGNNRGARGPATAKKAIRIPGAFTKHFILVLASEPPGAFDVISPGYHDFIISVLELYLPLAELATVSLTPLRDLISRVLEMPREVCIIEKIVSETTGATIMKQLLENNSLIRQVFTDFSLRLFGSRLAKLITSCISSHGSAIEDVVLIWEKMENTHKNIEEQVLKIESGQRATVTVGRAPIYLSEAERELLDLARIAVPYNITTARHATQCLLERYKDQIRLMLSSFPCSTCKARLSGVIKTRYHDTRDPERGLDFENTNAPLGVFPIYLSDTAIRDLKSSRVDGSLPRILRTLQKLADGKWESEVELSVSSDKSRTRSEPVLRAAQWCPEGYVLWERGIGRAEGNSEEWTQIVKIIRIGSRSDMKATISAARKAQRTYTKEYRTAAAISIQNPAHPGTLIPKTFIGKSAVGLEVNNMTVFGLPSLSSKLAPSDALVLHKIFCTGM
ncbi:hypothetical protein ABW20_dc0103044 [Dactylellina cionopaga]|nr:hypothetical protein ABW20_dc0103044 [Dactylellina cionopaga]